MSESKEGMCILRSVWVEWKVVKEAKRRRREDKEEDIKRRKIRVILRKLKNGKTIRRNIEFHIRWSLKEIILKEVGDYIGKLERKSDSANSKKRIKTKVKEYRRVMLIQIVYNI